ncbi:nuclease-related domain-containing protein [Metabacillus sp. 113a]|uniref:nuclease-related domain-containing protein n=1 Tax=Metabacillus sp. 113a TaxID=3404706 RepID=UPI003CE7990A
MIAKPRKTPLYILKLQALLRRLPPSHPKVPQITEELTKRMAGFKGELAADYQLSLIDHPNRVILTDLRLPHAFTHFQMDTLIISPKAAVIIEVKNIAGTIYFDPKFNQLIRRKDGQETAFADPVLQSRRLEFQFSEWLRKNHFPALPIHTLIVISNPQTIIETPSAHSAALAKKVIHAQMLPFELKLLEAQYKKVFLTEKELEKMARSLNRANEEIDVQITNKYGILHSELVKGVLCPDCRGRFERYKGGWLCSGCQNKNKLAHLEALNDYRLLIGSTITNKKIREYLSLVSPSSATKLLQSLNLKSSGQNKGRVYELELQEKSTPS